MGYAGMDRENKDNNVMPMGAALKEVARRVKLKKINDVEYQYGEHLNQSWNEVLDRFGMELEDSCCPANEKAWELYYKICLARKKWRKLNRNKRLD